jgi:hypothetical protein
MQEGHEKGKRGKKKKKKKKDSTVSVIPDWSEDGQHFEEVCCGKELPRSGP